MQWFVKQGNEFRVELDLGERVEHLADGLLGRGVRRFAGQVRDDDVRPAHRQVQPVLDDFRYRERKIEAADAAEGLGAAACVRQVGAREAGDPPARHHDGIVERAARQFRAGGLEQLVEFCHQIGHPTRGYQRSPARHSAVGRGQFVAIFWKLVKILGHLAWNMAG